MSSAVNPSRNRPRCGLAASLPADLADAYEAAGLHVFMAVTIVGISTMATRRGKPLGSGFADGLIRFLDDFLPRRGERTHIKCVRAELMLASDPAARFNATSAHEAGVEYLDAVLDVMWQSADLLGWLRARSETNPPLPVDLIRSKIASVCVAVAEESWPDDTAILNAICFEALTAARARLQTTGNEEKPPPPDPFTALRRFARDELKGQERAVVESLCDAGGELPINDLAVKNGVGWEDPFQGFKDIQRRLNPKLKPECWRLGRRNNAGYLVTL